MRILQESEKIYAGFQVNNDTFIKDKKSMENHYNLSAKKNIIMPSLLLAIALFTILGIILCFYLWILGLIFILIGIASALLFYILNKKNNDEKNKLFLESYDNAINQNSKINLNVARPISSIIPIYIDCDNTLKAIKIIDIKKIIMFCEYDDILNYRLLINDKEVEETKINNIDDSESYAIEITFNNKKKASFYFSNRIKKLKINSSYNKLTEINAISINKIADILDMIIMKNEVK